MVFEARSMKLGYYQGHSPPETWFASFQLGGRLAVFGIRQLAAVSLQSVPLLSHVFTLCLCLDVAMAISLKVI